MIWGFGEIYFSVSLYQVFHRNHSDVIRNIKAHIFKQGNVFLYVVGKYGAETCTSYINVSQSSYPRKIRHHVIQNLNEAMDKWHVKNIPYVALLERSFYAIGN